MVFSSFHEAHKAVQLISMNAGTCCCRSEVGECRVAGKARTCGGLTAANHENFLEDVLFLLDPNNGGEAVFTEDEGRQAQDRTAVDATSRWFRDFAQKWAELVELEEIITERVVDNRSNPKRKITLRTKMKPPSTGGEEQHEEGWTKQHEALWIAVTERFKKDAVAAAGRLQVYVAEEARREEAGAAKKAEERPPAKSLTWVVSSGGARPVKPRPEEDSDVESKPSTPEPRIKEGSQRKRRFPRRVT